MAPPKKAAAKHAPPTPLKEERRAHEHLARVEALHAHLDKPAAKQVTLLIDLAHNELEAGSPKNAADLLRAAEHFSFSAVRTTKKPNDAHPKLLDEFRNELDHKLEQAQERWEQGNEHDPALEEAYANATGRAREFFDAGDYCQALELARGAEALTHVHLNRSSDSGSGK